MLSIYRSVALIPIALVALAAPLRAEVPSSEVQVAMAVAPAPNDQQETASVLGYSSAGELVMLREGDGELVCLGDDPSDDRYHAACYHRDLEPFMARGRALRAEGQEREAIQEARRAEIEAGTLALPADPRALYSLTCKPSCFDAESGETPGAVRVYVLYTPGATHEATGLPAEPTTPGGPWLMNSGEPWAHVMIVQAPPEPAVGEADEDEPAD